MIDFIRFILDQVLKSNYAISIENGRVLVDCNNITYEETIFYCDSAFDEDDISSLKDLTSQVLSLNEMDWNKFTSCKSLLRWWYLITHEKYLQEDIKLDKYGRIGFENVKEPFKEILLVPISETNIFFIGLSIVEYVYCVRLSPP